MTRNEREGLTKEKEQRIDKQSTIEVEWLNECRNALDACRFTKVHRVPLRHDSIASRIPSDRWLVPSTPCRQSTTKKTKRDIRWCTPKSFSLLLCWALVVTRKRWTAIQRSLDSILSFAYIWCMVSNDHRKLVVSSNCHSWFRSETTDCLSPTV